MIHFAQLALDGIGRDYPHAPQHIWNSDRDGQPHRQYHPVFSGCFDWHSAVHSHWLLVRLLAVGAVDDPSIRSTLDQRFDPDGLRREADYLIEHPTFERPYGWAWVLRLAAELAAWDDPDARRWAERLSPLTEVVIDAALAYLDRIDRPVRTGIHTDSGFALAQFLDAAVVLNHDRLAERVHERAVEWYGNDRDYPFNYEPSATDFFSSGLNEIDLLRRILSPDELATWLDRFAPAWSHGSLGTLSTPLTVADQSDGHLVHLAGLNLSRAWTMTSLAEVMTDDRGDLLLDAAERHASAGLAEVGSGDWAGDHWLATFAVYLLTGVGR